VEVAINNPTRREMFVTSIFQSNFATTLASAPNVPVKNDAYCAALFYDMRNLKFNAQPTNALPAIDQMVGRSSQLPATAEHCFRLCSAI